MIDFGIAYKEDLDRVFDVMRRVAREMRDSTDWSARMLDDIEIAGVENWADSAVMLRARIKVPPLEQWPVRREYFRRLKKTFDAARIEIPYPHVTLYAGTDPAAQPFPLSLLGGESAVRRGQSATPVP